MLPRDIGVNLTPSKEPKFAISLLFLMDAQGRILLDHDQHGFRYKKTLVTNKEKLSYEKADAIIASLDANPTDTDNQTAMSLKLFSQAIQRRKIFRDQFQETSGKEEKGESKSIVEELMLLSQVLLQHYHVNTVDKAKAYITEYA